MSLGSLCQEKFANNMASDTFPRLPTDEEKKLIAETVFDEKPVSEVDFSGVWMLAPFINELEFNCMGWSLLLNQFICIPGTVANVNYLAGRAIEEYHAPYDYVPTAFGAADAVIRVWGSDPKDVMHVSRFCTMDELKKYAVDFGAELDFDAPSAKGFPKETWTSKYGVKNAFTTHPKGWLENSVWGKGVEDLKLK